MAIAANFRKYAQALALQLVLPFGRPVWNGARPSTKLGRAVRAFVTASMKARGAVEYPVPRPVPQWWKAAQQRARQFAKFARSGQMAMDVRGPAPASLLPSSAAGIACRGQAVALR